MSQLLARLLSTLGHELSVREEAPARPLEPPATAAESAAKGLRQVIERGQSAEASAAQAQMAAQAQIELFATESHALCLCAWVAESSSMIHAIDVAEAVDTADAGLARWGHLRTNLLAVLLHMASSPSPSSSQESRADHHAVQGRCVELLETTERRQPRAEQQEQRESGTHNADDGAQQDGAAEQQSAGDELVGGDRHPPPPARRAGAASVCLDLLESHAARVDLAGVQFATNLLRNLALPASSRALIGKLRGESASDPLSVLLKHVGHSDPGVCLHVGATLRILTEGCEANVRRYLTASPPPAHALAPLLELGMFADGSRVPPHARVELSRFASNVMAAAASSGEDEQCGLARLSNGDSSQGEAAAGFPAFLLGSSHRPLHLEACAGLRALLRAQPSAEGAAPWVGLQVAVRRGGRQMPLHAALLEIVASGGLTHEECGPLLTTESGVVEVQ